VDPAFRGGGGTGRGVGRAVGGLGYGKLHRRRRCGENVPQGGESATGVLVSTGDTAVGAETWLIGVRASLEHGASNGRMEAMNTGLRLLARRAYGFHGPDTLVAPPGRSTRPRHVHQPGANDVHARVSGAAGSISAPRGRRRRRLGPATPDRP